MRCWHLSSQCRVTSSNPNFVYKIEDWASYFKKKCILKDPILLGNDFVEAIFGIVVSCFDGSRLDGLLFCRGGVGCLACLVLYFVEAPFMSIFCVWFAPFLAAMWGVNGLAVTVSSMPAILICSNCSSRFFTSASTLVASIESFAISLAVSRCHISGWSWSLKNPATQWLRKALLSKLALTETKHQVCGDSLISSEDPSRSMVGEISLKYSTQLRNLNSPPGKGSKATCSIASWLSAKSAASRTSKWKPFPLTFAAYSLIFWTTSGLGSCPPKELL